MFLTLFLSETVAFNTKTYKFHKLYCQWAKKCTVNCITIEKREVVKRGGIPCKVCGGESYGFLILVNSAEQKSD